MNLEHLNEAQQQAVIHTDGPVMILAGAGSGKTRTLVTRIQYLLEEKSVPTFQILAVTFSNKAAKEMRERIASETNLDIGALQITTFHAFCAKVLRNEAQYLGLSRNFTIYDQSEAKSVVKSVLGQRGVSQKEINPSEILYYIDGLKNSGHYPNCPVDELTDPVDKADLFYSFYQDYEEELHRSNAVDFGGLICGVLQLFDQYPEVLKRYQKRFRYLLVDEYQDTNRAQFKLIKLLSEEYRNICVVGDEDQSIYSWRGADLRNILDYEKYYPETAVIKLEQNYRSSKNIIEAASFVIAKNQMRKGKEMWTDNDQGEYIAIIDCADDRAESEYIATEIKKLVDEGVSPTEIAVFYRTNAQSRMIEDALRVKRIAYRVVAGIKFYERKEIKDLLSYIRVVVNEKDSLALTRIINIPVRGIGATTLRKIEDEAIRLKLSMWETIERIVENVQDYKELRLSSKVLNSLGAFVSLIQEVKIQEKDGKQPSYTYQKLLVESGYLDALKAEKTHEAQARIENLDELLSAIKQYEEYEENPSLVGFLETVTLDSDLDASVEPSSEVSLMTIHGSKGLEYHYVFVSGVEESVFPSFRSLEEGPEAIEEERRLFYVAMTRAMKKLYILFAQGRMLWGSVKFNGPSRFLDEIPEDYYQWKNYHPKAFNKNFNNTKSFDQYSQVNEYDDSNSNDVYVNKTPSVAKTKANELSKYPSGVKVRHQLYGIGTVLSSDGLGADEKVLIKFSDGNTKRFMVKFAPLEMLS